MHYQTGHSIVILSVTNLPSLYYLNYICTLP